MRGADRGCLLGDVLFVTSRVRGEREACERARGRAGVHNTRAAAINEHAEIVQLIADKGAKMNVQGYVRFSFSFFFSFFAVIHFFCS